MLHLPDEFFPAALLQDHQLAVTAFGPKALGGKSTAVDQLLCVLSNIDEAAAAGQTADLAAITKRVLDEKDLVSLSFETYYHPSRSIFMILSSYL